MDFDATRQRCLTPGKLTDLYDVGQVLGRGGFATVRVGADRKTGYRVALKILNPRAYFRDPVQTQAIFHEIMVLQVVQRLRNPNLLRFIAAYEDISASSGLPRLVIVSDLCSGGELFDRIVNKGHYAEADASVLVAKLANALDALHDYNIIHRDIKPENILYLTEAADSEPVIADFGLSKEISAPESQTTLVGTPGYVSPEVIRDRQYTPACDVWALGVITYILLCGYPPFYAENNKDLYAQICAGIYEFHEDAWSEVSNEAKDIIRRMLTVPVQQRASLKDVLAHPWITRTQSSRHLTAAIRNLKEFNGRRKIKAAARAVMWGAAHAAVTKDLMSLVDSRAFTSEEVSALLAQFHHVSKGKNTVNLDQFKEVLEGSGLCGLPSDRLFELFDADGSGDVDHREFLCGLARLRGDDEEALKLCFRIYDADGNGYITKEELFGLLQTTGMDLIGGQLISVPGSPRSAGLPMQLLDEQRFRKLEELFARVDLNKDGKLSLDEFRSAAKSEPLLTEAIFNPLRRFDSRTALKAASPMTSRSSSPVAMDIVPL